MATQHTLRVFPCQHLLPVGRKLCAALLLVREVGVFAALAPSPACLEPPVFKHFAGGIIAWSTHNATTWMRA